MEKRVTMNIKDLPPGFVEAVRKALREGRSTTPLLHQARAIIAYNPSIVLNHVEVPEEELLVPKSDSYDRRFLCPKCGRSPDVDVSIVSRADGSLVAGTYRCVDQHAWRVV